MKKITYIFILIFTCSCSTFYGGSTNTEALQDVSDLAPSIDFSGSIGTTSYQSIQFTNRSNDVYQVNNMALDNNSCASFSVHSITNSNGDVLYLSGDVIDVTVHPSETINFNIQFSPQPCAQTSYTSNFLIYYTRNDELFFDTVNLIATVEGTAPDSVVCEENNREYYDEFDNPTTRTLPALGNDKPYYLKVIKTNGYLQTTQAFVNYSMAVSTHLNLDAIDEADRFQPAYLPIYAKEDGTLTLNAFDQCTNFFFPSPITDRFFLGANTFVTTNDPFTGTIDRETNKGRINFENVSINLFSYINNSNSLAQSPEGFFEVNVNVDLTTGLTPIYDDYDYSQYLPDLADLVDDEGEQYLNITGGQLEGRDLRHGTVTLVGVGRFMLDDDTQLSNEAQQALIFENNEAYIFIQIKGMITQEIE